jgi:AraC-like DNA-binding protein
MIQMISNSFVNVGGELKTPIDNLIESLQIRIIGCGIHTSDTRILDHFLLPAFLLVYYQSGQVELMCRNQKTLLQPGSFYIFRPYEIYSGTRLGDVPIQFAFLQFDISPFMERYHFETNILPFAEDLIQEERYACFGAMLEELCLAPPDTNGRAAMLHLYVKHLAAQIIYDQSGRSGSPKVIGAGHQSQLINAVFQYVVEHISEPIVISRMVHDVHTSKTTINKTFRAVLNQTPQQAIMRFKLERAMEMLQQNTPIKCIARDLGFSSVYHFSNTFNDVIGLRPTDYREKRHLDMKFSRPAPAAEPDAHPSI